LQATGVEYQNGNQVSAIIFPLKTDLYPANARGLVQVIQKIEAQKTIEIKERFFQGGNLPTDDEKEELGYRSLDSYKLDYLKDKYTHYCQLSYRFMCDKPNYTARELLGNIGRDWSPLGYSKRVRPKKGVCDVTEATYCATPDWDKMKSELAANMGARAFLIANLEIDNIPGRILIDFQNPDKEIIPDIGLR
jgi:hypothetical protein